MSDIVLKTERCTLQKLVRADVPEIFRIVKKYPHITNYMLWNPPRDISESYSAFDNNHPENIRFSIKIQGKFVGTIALMKKGAIAMESDFFHVGFWISPDFQNQGIISECVLAVIRFAFEELKIFRLKSGAMGPNIASQRVLEKVGFRKVGIERKRFQKNGKLHDDHLYELLKEDYLAKKNFRKENALEIWGEQKKGFRKFSFEDSFYVREIWWAHLGENVGVEQNGKGEEFLRPVLILQKFNQHHIVIIPLTTQRSQEKFSFYLNRNIKFLKQDCWLIFSQIKVLDSARLHKKMGKISVGLFTQIQKKSIEVIYPEVKINHPRLERVGSVA